MKKLWKIPVTWTVYGTAEYEAETLAEAMENVSAFGDDIPLPPETGYVDSSFQLSHGMDEIEIVRAGYNGGASDEPNHKTMKATHIEWDIDDINEEITLPSEIEIPDNMDKDKIADYLSDMTGYCHKGYILTTKE